MTIPPKWIGLKRGNPTQGVEAIRNLLEFIGEDADRGGLKETPERVAKAFLEWTKGYEQDPKEVFKVFDDGGARYDGMVIVRRIPFYSLCEHHLAPFFGVSSIAYIPEGEKIIGLSKLGRLLDIFAKRLQVQERLTVDIADAIEQNLQPKGVGVIIEARHLCMESRGLEKQGQDTLTSALRGVFVQEAVRLEFLALVNGRG